jgi:hypothetical protein
MDKNLLTKDIYSEQTFMVDSFYKSATFTDILALAKRIQNLLLMEPDTLPNQTKLGVGIKNFIMEKADNNTISAIKDAIDYQLNAFLPSSYIARYDVSFKIDLDTGKRSISVKFDLKYNEVTKNFANNYFIINFNTISEFTKTEVVSTIYI